MKSKLSSVAYEKKLREFNYENKIVDAALDRKERVFFESIPEYKQNLQEEYVSRLLSIVDTKSAHAYTSKSAAFGEVKRILDWMNAYSGGDAATKAHRAHLAFVINKALEDK